MDRAVCKFVNIVRCLIANYARDLENIRWFWDLIREKSMICFENVKNIVQIFDTYMYISKSNSLIVLDFTISVNGSSCNILVEK